MAYPPKIETLKGKQLTFKQRAWIDEYLKTGNATKAALKVYDTDDYKTASVIASENIAKLSYDWLMDVAGISDDRLLKKLQAKLDAQSNVIVGDKVYKEDDHSTQMRALDMAFKLKNRYPSSKVELTGRDGGPLQMEVLAGLAFLPKQNAKDTNTEPEGDAQMAITSLVYEPEEVQGTDMAQEGEEDNDSNLGTPETSVS